MKTTEFENLVKRAGFKTCYCGDNLYVTRTNESDILSVNTKYANVVNTNFINFYNYLSSKQQTQFLDLAYKLAKTPIEDRLEEKKYYLKTASPLVSEQTQYLNYNRLSEKYFYSSVYNDEDHIKYIFTQTEVDNMDTTGLIPEPITDSEEEN